MAVTKTKAQKKGVTKAKAKPYAKKRPSKAERHAAKNAETMTSELDEDDLSELESRDFAGLIKQVQSEYNAGWWFIKPKWDEWALRLKLYNNQKRDKEAVGDNTLFTIFQTMFASLYSDQLSASFAPRESGDDEVAENLDLMAEYDYDEMEKDIIDYEWDFETMFFGRGLCAMMDFDRETYTPVPEIWNVMTVIRDPQARSVNGDKRGRGRARFLYREVRMTKDEMADLGVYFNFKNVKASTTTSTRSLVDENMRVVADAAGLADTSKFSNVDGDNATIRLLEGFTMYKGKRCFVTLADDMKRVVRYHELEGKDIPIVDRTLFPVPTSWDSVSIPDLVEDKQRARAVALNLSLKSVKSALHPMYLFDSTRVTNRADLNFEFNKFIPVNGNTNGAVTVMPKDAVKQDVAFILDTLSQGAERSTATPDIQQGARPDEAGTATRDALISQKVDTRYSLAARVFGWSEKRFWKQWYALYKAHFKADIDKKNIRIVGALGAKWRPFTRENLIAQADPDVKIESKVVSEARRFNELQLFRGYVQMLAPIAGANIRFALKYMGKLSGLKKDIIDHLLPQTIEEIRAEEENEQLRNDELVNVTPQDDHATHMEIHNKMEDTPAKYAHINAHKRAMLLQRARPDMFPPEPPAANPEQIAGQGGLPQPAADTNGKGRVLPSR